GKLIDKNIGEGFDSDSQSPKQSDSEEASKPRKQGRPRKNPLPTKPETAPVRPVTSRRAKTKVVYEEDDEDEEEEEDQEDPQPAPKQQKQQKVAARSKQQPAKTGVRQTKMEDFSPKGRGGGGKALNGASSTVAATTAKTSAQKGAGRGQSSQAAVVKRFGTSPTAVSPNRSRMLGAESDDSMSSSKGGDDRPSPAVVRRLKPPMLRENIVFLKLRTRMTRPSPTKSAGSRKRSPPSSPSSASASPSHYKKAKLGSSESGSERSWSPPSLPAKRGPVSRPEPLKSNIRNVRRVVSNGTSDGEDAPETSQSVSMSPEHSQEKDEETLNVKRKTRVRRK
ncbi:hypothetical protein EGW08_016622, partial [Elysia chlorotica]